ncbi:MAG: hypothetical protein GXY39_03265 [Actinomycetales bacterium]|nr:hypothetical protein [Actinomycetales bacterium]
MPELPASVRVALWTSFAWSAGAEQTAVLRRALPDVDLVLGLEDKLRLWRDLGEQAVYAALPRPGAAGLLPRCGTDAYGAATSAGEAVFVAGVGGLAVPRLVTFGADRELTAAGSDARQRTASRSPGLAVRWESFDAEPVPVHRLSGLDVTGVDRRLRTEVHAAIDRLGDGGWVDAWQRERPSQVERSWSLPPALPERVRGLLVRAGSILEITDAGLSHAEGSSSVHLRASRSAVLLTLQGAAVEAMETAACAASSYFAAQSRTTRS